MKRPKDYNWLWACGFVGKNFYIMPFVGLHDGMCFAIKALDGYWIFEKADTQKFLDELHKHHYKQVLWGENYSVYKLKEIAADIDGEKTVVIEPPQPFFTLNIINQSGKKDFTEIEFE